MSYRRRFEEFGVAWPSLDRPALPFSPTVRVADIVYVSGQIPEIGQEIAAIGQVGREIDLAAARNAARLCAANIVYWLDKELDGNLDRVVKFAKLTVYVNAAAGFSPYSEVGNGASEFLLHVFGERGEHARCSLGMAGLPANVPVEADAIVHVR